MALEKAGINLTLQGEAQYIAGLRNINRETELMALNTKLAVAQLGTGASPTQRYSTQMRQLGAEIEKASTKTMILRNRNKELPNQIFKTGKSLDVLKDAYEKQVKVQDDLQKKKEQVVQTYGYGTQEFYKSRDALNEQNEVTAAAKEEVDKLEKSYNSMLDEYERMPNTMTAAQIATQNLINEQAKLREEYLNSGGVLAGFANKLDSGAETLEKYGRNLSDLGSSFMGVTGAIVAGGGGALKVYMDWETAFQGTKKTVDEMTESVDGVTYTYDQLERGLRDLSLEIPIAADELAEMGEIAGRLQIPANEVVHFTEVMAKMAVTTDLSSEEAAESFGKFLNITLSGTETTQNLANAIVELGNNTAATESDIIRMGTRWASTGKIIGMTDEQIIGTSATLLSLGVRAEAGGSSLQRAFQKINDAVLDSSDKLTGFAKVAEMGASDFAEAWSNDPVEALVPFLKGLSEIHEEGGNVNGIMRDLGISSVNELNSILVLAQGYEQLADNVGMAGEAYHETNEAQMALNEEARVAFDTTKNKLILAWSRLKDQLIDIGEPVADALLDMVGAAEPVFETIERMAQGFTDLDKTAQRDLMKTVARIALIAPALKLAGGAMQGLSTIFELGAGITRVSGKTITKVMGGIGTEATTLTTVASTAAGAKGVGGLVTALGTGLPWALGISAAALGGWTLWKNWGEGAYEAGQRTRQWGADVNESTSDVLTDIGETIGTYGLLQQGVKTDTALMVGDFQKMGQSIENDINQRLQTTNNYISGLPDALQDSMQRILREYQVGLEETQQIVAENNEEIARVQAEIAEQGGEATAQQLAYINELQRNSAQEYIGILNLNADEEKAIRGALAGDIDAISKKQTLNIIALLNEENMALDQQRIEVKEGAMAMLEELGLANTKYGQEMVDSIDRYYDEMQSTGERTMQELVSIYPEIAQTHDLATGNILSTVDHVRKRQLASNEMLLESWVESHRIMETSSRELAAAEELMIDSSKAGAKTWNKIVLDSNGSMEEFRKKIMEATETAEGWNHIRFQIHEANLDSNVRSVIAEAAIKNGWWDGMSWEDKQALLEDNFSETVYQAIVEEGIWADLDWAERIAMLNNGFSDTVVQAIMDENKWAELPYEEKKAILTTNSPEALEQILRDLNLWETMPIAVRQLFADKTPLDETVEAAQRKLNSLEDKEVTLTTRNLTIYESINRAGSSRSSNDFVQSGGRILHDNHARGTNHHPGGPAIVNDQQGATFRELVTLPDGSSFVPSGRNVMLDLPKGSKVLRAALTKIKMPNLPQYARGVGYSKQQTRQLVNSSSADMNQTNRLLETLIDMASGGQNVSINIDGREFAQATIGHINNENNNKGNYYQRGLAISGH